MTFIANGLNLDQIIFGDPVIEDLKQQIANGLAVPRHLLWGEGITFPKHSKNKVTIP